MFDFLKKWKKYFIFAAVLSCFINILQLTFAFYMFTIYRQIVVSYSQVSLYTITVIALYALVSLGLFNYLRTRLLSVAAVDLNQGQKETVYKNMLKGYAGPWKKAYVAGLADLEALRNYFSSQAVFALFDVPWTPLYLLLIYFFHPVLGMVATVGALVIFGLSILQDVLTRKKIARANVMNSQNRRMVDAALRNAEAANSMGMLPGLCRHYDQSNESVITNQTSASRKAGVLQSITRPMQLFMQVLMYGIGAYYALLGQFSVGLMVAASIIMGQAVGPLMRVMGTWRLTLQSKEAFKRLSRFTAMVQEMPEKMDLPVPRGKITAENVVLRLGESLVLKNVSFNLNPGEILGLIGPSGAGKTTLCRVLLGVWPSMGGKVRLDDVDMFYWQQEQLGRYIGYLPQDVELFEASVAKNIARMGEADPELVENAAKAAGVKDLIEALPQGHDTKLYGADGVALSGGQKQLLGLARALYGDPRLLILDEPNSNLDAAGERVLVNLLAEFRAKRICTCVVVTHKPELLNNADKLLILQNGRVVDFGARDEVMQRLTKSTRQQQAV